MKSTLALAALLVAAAPASAEPDKVQQGGFGCRSQADFTRAVTFASQGDEEAFRKFLTERIRAKACIALRVGQEIFLEQNTLDGLICARPRGEVDCWWTAFTIIHAQD